MRRSHFARTTIAIIAVLMAAGIWLGAARQQPEHVFGDMLRNNLSSAGVTRVISQTGQGLSVTQYNQLSLGARPVAHALTVFKQSSGTVATEEVSNQTSDYVRYQTIQTSRKTATGKPLDTSSIVGKWAKLQAGGSINGTLSSGLFSQSLISILPIANLTSADRASLLATIQKLGVFSYNPKTVKVVQVAGRKAYQFNVSIKPAAYITMMQQFEKLVGVHNYAAISPSQYVSAQPIAVQISVDARSHQLAETYQTSTKRAERYEGFGITDTTNLPKATLTTTQLTQRLAALGN